LAFTISLKSEEKQGIIDNYAKLSSLQIEELLKIFKEEQRKFAMLALEYQSQLANMAHSAKTGKNAYINKNKPNVI
jgi:hypothetical protein